MTALEEWTLRVQEYLAAGIGIIDAYDAVHGDAPGVVAPSPGRSVPPARAPAGAGAPPAISHTRDGEAPALATVAQHRLHLLRQGVTEPQHVPPPGQGLGVLAELQGVLADVGARERASCKACCSTAASKASAGSSVMSCALVTSWALGIACLLGRGMTTMDVSIAQAPAWGRGAVPRRVV